MADGFFHLYQTNWSQARAAQRIKSMSLAGAALTNPSTGKILSGDWDDQLEQIPIDENSLLQRLALTDRDSQSFDYWLSGDTNIYCRVRRVKPDVVVEEFSLDGFGGPRYELGQDQVIRLILDQMHQTGSSVVGLIVDRWGTSLEIDIDDAVLGGPTPVTIVPELLILRPEVADQHPELNGWGRRQYGEFVAFDSTGILDRM